jgi:hypothetical protein
MTANGSGAGPGKGDATKTPSPVKTTESILMVPRAEAILLAAHEYRANGWRVLPIHAVDEQGCTCRRAVCNSQGKHPVENRWQATPPLSGADIQATFEDGGRNVGIATGALSGLWVLDVDLDKPGTEDRLREMLAGRVLPATHTVRTPGGWHHYFAMPDFPVTNSAKRLPDGVDVRGTGGMVVAPPSVSGKGAYAIATEAPDWSEGVADVIAEAPPWLLDRVRPLPPAAPVDLETVPKLTDLPPAQRERLSVYTDRVVVAELARLDECTAKGWSGPPWNQTTFEVACQLIELAHSSWCPLTLDDAHRLLLERAPRDVGFTVADVEGRFTSALRTVAGKGRAMPEAPTAGPVYPGDPLSDRSARTAPAGPKRPAAVPTAPGDPQVPAGVPEFPWEDRPILQHLHTFARSRRVAPFALLGNVLGRAAAMTSVRYVLPPLTGKLGTLDLCCAFVGPSGAGKGTVHGAAQDAIDWSGWRDPISGQPLRRIGLGSGEGIAHQYARRTKTGEPERIREAVVFDCPEVDQLAALASRQGTTLTAVIRTAWSGEALGSAYVDGAKALDLPDRSYRFALTLGVQPGRAEPLLNQGAVDGGTPQRFVWVLVLDPEAPDVAPPEPEPIPVALPPVPLAQHIVGVCAEARADIDQARVAQLRGEVGDHLDGHALYTRLKAAAALAVLDGHLGTDGVRADDWTLAGQLMAVSDATRAAVQDALATAAASSNLARGRAEGEREVVKADTVAAAELRRAGQGVMRFLAKHPGEWVKGKAVRTSLAGPLRQHFAEAVEMLATAGQVEVEIVEHHGQTGLRLRTTVGS